MAFLRSNLLSQNERVSIGLTDLNSEGSFYFVAGPAAGRAESRRIIVFNHAAFAIAGTTVLENGTALEVYSARFRPGQPDNGATNTQEQGQHCVVWAVSENIYRVFEDVRCASWQSFT